MYTNAKLKKVFNTTNLLAAFALFLAAAVEMPYSYYMFLRWFIVFCSIIIIFILCIDIKIISFDTLLIVFFVGILIVFNPFFPFLFTRDIWRVIDFASLFVFFMLGFASMDM